MICTVDVETPDIQIYSFINIFNGNHKINSEKNYEKFSNSQLLDKTYWSCYFLDLETICRFILTNFVNKNASIQKLKGKKNFLKII